MEFSIGAVGAAFIGAVVTLLGLIISKENKTSEFRQIWIDSLRSEIRDFLVALNAIADASHRSYTSQDDQIDKLSPLYSELNSALFSVSLRLNGEEEGAQELMTAANELVNLTRASGTIAPTDIRPLEQHFQKMAKKLLKEEWERVKKGEPFFAFVKWSALIIGLVSAPMIVYQTLKGNEEEVVTKDSEIGVISKELATPTPAQSPTP